MNQPDVSIILVHYNTTDLLPDCLSSVQAAKGDLSVEVLVVDNASDQGSVRHGTRGQDNLRLIILNHNLGFSAAANAGFEKSTGRYLLLLNADARLGLDCLEPMVRFLDSHPKAGVLGPLHKNPAGKVQPSWGSFPTFRSELLRKSLHTSVSSNLPRFDKLLTSRAKKTDTTDWVAGSCMLIRRSAFEAVGGFDTRFFLYFEDIDFCRRVRDSGHTVHLLAKAEIVHIGGAATRRQPQRTAIIYRQSQFAFLRKYYPPYVCWLTRLGVMGKSAGLWFFSLVGYLEHMPGDLAKEKAAQMKLHRKVLWTALFESRAK